MVEQLTDKEQIDLLRKWWGDYGKYILIAVIIGLGASFGWRYWQKYQARKNQYASGIYQQALTMVQNKDYATLYQITDKLTKDYPASPYAPLVNLLAARGAVVQNKLANAYQYLNWVIAHGQQNSLKQIARLRAARVLLAESKPQDALNLIKTVDDKSYQGLVYATRGDIYTAQGKTKQAAAAYKQAKDLLSGQNIQDPLVAAATS